MDIIKNWNDGAPYMGANPGIDPGQMGYWNNGAPHINLYENPVSFGWKSILTVDSANTKSFLTVEAANIKSILTIE